MSDLPPIPVVRKSGSERFHRSGQTAPQSLLDFWQWSGSDLLGNTARGIIAEYIVALDLGVADGIWSGWDPFDIQTKDGTKVEVKSAAYLQTWRQKEFSKIIFGVGPTAAWDPETGELRDGKKRWSDVYVFCVLATKNVEQLDVLDLDQWDFYVLPTRILDREIPEQKTVALGTLSRLGAAKAAFGEIGSTIEKCLGLP